MPTPRPLTAKGQRGATRILDAATKVLARDGYGGATIARIAEEAGVEKRSVLYYYGTREELLVRVVRTVGGAIAETVGGAAEPGRSPEQVIDALLDSIWGGVTAAPEASRAYFALLGAGTSAPVVEEALADLKAAFIDAIVRRLRTVDSGRWHLAMDERTTAAYTLAIIRGLLLEWTEAGSDGAAGPGLERCKLALQREFVPVA